MRAQRIFMQRPMNVSLFFVCIQGKCQKYHCIHMMIRFAGGLVYGAHNRYHHFAVSTDISASIIPILVWRYS